eukprot:5509888-Pyramimonas_sp.AAC.1
MQHIFPRGSASGGTGGFLLQGILRPWAVRHKKETWPAEDTVHLWDKLPNHRESWALILVFAGRVLTRFSRRICQDGTLVSREVPKFTDIDKAVTL